MSELGFRFGFGLYMISCIIMRDSSQKVYHGLAAKKKASGQVWSIFYPTNDFYPILASILLHNLLSGKKCREAHLVKSYEPEGRVCPQTFAIVGRLHPDLPKIASRPEDFLVESYDP